jgi:hypothetical protein
MYEISGITCAGKSTKLVNIALKKSIFLKKKSVLHFLFGFFFLFKMANFKKLNFIIRKTYYADDRIFLKIKVFLNTIAKFYYINIDTNELVDEGFIQIPFLLMLSDDEVDNFFTLFLQEISKVNLFWISAEKKIIIERLSIRGHHRFAGKNKAYMLWFIDKNLQIMKRIEYNLNKHKVNYENVNEY